LAPVALLVSIINTVGLWVSRPGRIAKERHDALKEQVDRQHKQLSENTLQSFKAHDRRIQAVENELRHLPSKDDLHRLSEQVTRLGTKLETQVESLGHSMRRIDDFLRED